MAKNKKPRKRYNPRCKVVGFKCYEQKVVDNVRARWRNAEISLHMRLPQGECTVDELKDATHLFVGAMFAYVHRFEDAGPETDAAVQQILNAYETVARVTAGKAPDDKLVLFGDDVMRIRDAAQVTGEFLLAELDDHPVCIIDEINAADLLARSVKAPTVRYRVTRRLVNAALDELHKIVYTIQPCDYKRQTELSMKRLRLLAESTEKLVGT